ncbi:DUF6924 domain-containing protein [Micromonospora sp. NPDC050417]|uniref:DUF6924 domain-containing protein n=1 Tax=Micromonospora sp. NPDC050417 TaxID=3364280 RepID=UPI0037B9650E
MRALPARTEEFDSLIIRTDYSDEPAWQTVKVELAQLWDDEYEPNHQFVDDPAWAGATADEVLAAVDGMDDGPAVVFLADATTMRAAHHALLAVTTETEEEFRDGLDDDTIEFVREFRTVPVGVANIHVNLQLANMDFFEFADNAAEDPEGVHRAFM